MRVIVGLGNPGPAFEATRHNLGARAVRLLARRHRVQLMRDPLGALAGRVAGPPDDLLLAVPQTGMNDCGPVVQALLEREGLADPRALIVVHDELDLPVGRLKVKSGGGTAGHNGLRSIVDALGTADFLRVRIGVGKPPSRDAGIGYVLGRPGPADVERLDASAELAADAVDLVVAEGAGTAMTRFNQRSD
jgi:PTH1 family peptidyl-tRNA hydrolase